jgi:ABC-type dipeptide/oligopeptide/nickel transport system permease subunit
LALAYLVVTASVPEFRSVTNLIAFLVLEAILLFAFKVSGRFASGRSAFIGLIVLGALVVISSFTIPGFLSGPNVKAILLFAAFLGIACIGQTLVALLGGLDLSIPFVIGAANIGLLFVISLGVPSFVALIFVLVIGGFRWMPVARLVRAQFFSLREKEFVEAARALGASTPRQVTRHILPNSLGPVIVAGTIDVAAAILAESTLSFLGLGFPPDIPTWGRILFDAKDYLDIAPHWALFPGLAIFLAVLSINFIGDGLRDALDPRRVD